MPGTLGVVGGRIIMPPNPYSPASVWYSTSPTAGTVNNKGSWNQVVAATTGPTTAIGLTVNGVGASSSNRAALLDIGVGPSGSEVVVAGNIAVGMASLIEFLVPVAIPQGSRVALRHQNATSGAAMNVRTQFMNGGPLPFPPSSVDVLGTNPSTSRGATVSNTAWTEVVTTSVAYQAVVAVWSAGGTTALQATTGSSLVAYGAAGSEVQVNATYVATTTAEIITAINGAGWDCGACPAGTRISGRKSGNTNIELCIIGVPYA